MAHRIVRQLIQRETFLTLQGIKVKDELIYYGADEIRPTNVVGGKQSVGEILVSEDVSQHRTAVERGIIYNFIIT